MRAAAICLAGALSACGSLPPNAERLVSTAMLDTAQTRLGRVITPETAAPPGLSGFHPIGDGADAFLVRVAMARAAERSLDVQYYIFHADNTGGALLGELLAAADRGVRVRLLVDDLHLGGHDAALAALDSHPQIEVRLFNPFAHRSLRWLDAITDFARVNRRMHNKSMTADSQVSVVGGRNVGDEYFAATTAVEFGDFDVLAVGPVVREVVAEFDRYWNSEPVYPVAALGGHPGPEALPALRARIAQHVETVRATPYVRALEAGDLARQFAERKLMMHWGEASVIADDPAKVRLPAEDRSTHAGPRIKAALGGAQKELLLVSPYLVPGKEGVDWLRELTARGVRVRVLTNSFQSNDVRAVHAGYSAYREDLVRAGVELHELKPTAEVQLARDGRKRIRGSSSGSALHAKTYMADARTLFVGSFNLDPRSARLNTEMGVVIQSEALCAAVRESFLKGLHEIAYRVELDKASGKLAWITREDGREVRYDAEPGMGPLHHFMQGLLRMLPIEEQL
jgi:putative cardiolipin synthase